MLTCLLGCIETVPKYVSSYIGNVLLHVVPLVLGNKMSILILNIKEVSDPLLLT